ncbi:MAG: DUF1203 domain-containing protein [Steroidobacteraceae bacterium]
MAYRISGIPWVDVGHYLGLDDAGLQAAGIERCTADAPYAYPCRLTLEDAAPGEELLLLTYWHQPAPAPYAAAGPVFIRRSATDCRVVSNSIPLQQQRRLLSVRAYGDTHRIVAAEVMPGTDLEAGIEAFFARADVAYLHVHNARYGCYACRVDRC